MTAKQWTRHLLFLSLIVGIHLPLADFHERKLNKRNYAVLAQLESFADSLDILVLGDSHAGNGLDPRLLPGGFNWASGGESYLANYFRLKSLLERGVRPETVVLPLDLHSLSSLRSEQIPQGASWRRVISHSELREAFGIRYPMVFARGLLGRAPYVAKGTDLVRESLRPTVPKVFRGYTPQGSALFSEDRGQESLARIRAEAHLLGQEPITEEMRYFLRKILILCDDRGIRLVLIRFPVTREYFQVASALVPPDAYYQAIAVLVSAYPSALTLDHHDTYWGRNELFQDPNHLNAEGAAQFTALIRDELSRRF